MQLQIKTRTYQQMR